jgi:hypothetical protein
VRPPPAPFATTGLPSAVAPGQSFTVAVAFSPTAPGAYGGSFGFITQAGESAIALSGSATSPIALLASSGTHGASATRVVLDHLKLRFVASKSSRHKRKAKLSFRLSSAAKVRIIIYRRVVSHHCPRKAHSCIRYLPTSTKLTLNGHAGSNQFTLDLTRLSRGDYRLSATPIAPSSTAAITRSISFTVR